MGNQDRPYIEVRMRFSQEDDGQWTAECEELGTAGYADTLERAREAIADLVVLHLNGLEDFGTREAFFEKWGIKVHAPPDGPHRRQSTADESAYMPGTLPKCYRGPA